MYLLRLSINVKTIKYMIHVGIPYGLDWEKINGFDDIHSLLFNICIQHVTFLDSSRDKTAYCCEYHSDLNDIPEIASV